MTCFLKQDLDPINVTSLPQAKRKFRTPSNFKLSREKSLTSTPPQHPETAPQPRPGRAGPAKPADPVRAAVLHALRRQGKAVGAAVANSAARAREGKDRSWLPGKNDQSELQLHRFIGKEQKGYDAAVALLSVNLPDLST